MRVIDLPERMLQGAVHALLGAPEKKWLCTNGAQIQIIAAGMINVHDGPDYSDMAILCDGNIYVGAGEFHKKSSAWIAHNHQHDIKYEPVLLHVVLQNDSALDFAKWTLVLPSAELGSAMRKLKRDKGLGKISLPVEELQHFALLRLLRLTAHAQHTMQRLGPVKSVNALLAEWVERLSKKNHRPRTIEIAKQMLTNIADSTVGRLALQLPNIDAADIHLIAEQVESERIATEGSSLRRELFVNVVLPLCCARASDSQRIALLQWYWGAKAVHPYGLIRRAYPHLPQDYIWQQQGCLEYMRHHGQWTSTCGEVIKSYGIDRTVQFLRNA